MCIRDSNLIIEIQRRTFELIKEQEANNIINFSEIETSLKEEFSIKAGGSNSTIITKIMTSVEDDNSYGNPQLTEIDVTSVVLVERDQYVSTGVVINVNVS